MKQKETAAVLMVLLAAACWGANGIFINILTPTASTAPK